MSEDLELKLNVMVDKIRSDLKWAVGILASVLIAILAIYGQQINKLNTNSKDQAFDIMILSNMSEDLEWKQGWLVESSELQRDYIEAIAKGEDIKDFFDEMDRMNARIMANGGPKPTMRSGY